MIKEFNVFLLEKEFNSILNDTLMICEKYVEDGEVTDMDDSGRIKSMTFNYKYVPDDVEQEIENDVIEDDKADTTITDQQQSKIAQRLKSFLQKIPKNQITNYYKKYIDFITNNVPRLSAKKIIFTITSIFLMYTSIDNLMNTDVPQDIKKEIVDIDNNKKNASFDKSQKKVFNAEAGYSKDKNDNGNYVDTPYGKRFIGTKYGISAQQLQEYLKRLPTRKDMENLSYDTAVKILKENYWDVANLDGLKNQLLADIIYDGCVNQGVSALKDITKRALSDMNIDIKDSTDVFDDDVIDKINNYGNQYLLAKKILDYRKNRYMKSATAKTHLKGWLARLDKFYDELDTLKINSELANK